MTTSAHISTLAVVTFRGADAAHFLQGQLTTHTEALAPASWQRTAYCSRQGRIIANGILAHLPRAEGEEGDPCFAFVLSADVAEPLAATLKKFIMRAKVAVEVAPLQVFAANPAATPAALAGGSVTAQGDAIAIDEGEGKALLLREGDADAADAAATEEWQQAEITRGIAWISAATQDAIIPQFVNWETLGGVDFQKGCFVGQEVIARLHHLGEVKQRGMIVQGEGSAAAGGALKTADDKPCGTIINSAAGQGGFIAFAAVSRAQAQQGGITHNGNPVTITPPPYPIVEQEKFKRK